MVEPKKEFTMDYRKFGPTGIKVSAIGFGT